MARAPLQPGNMRQWCEYGRMVHQFTNDASMQRVFKKEGEFWAERRSASSFTRANLANTVDGIDISDDVSYLTTWNGHPVTSAHVIRLGTVIYHIVTISLHENERVVEYQVTTGLRDTPG